MKKFLKIAGLCAVMAAVVLAVGATAVFAQVPVNPDPVPGTGQRFGQTGNNGRGLGVMAVDQAEMHTVLAAALGMSVADFEAAIANGDTLATVALAQGVDLADLQAVMDTVHANAAAQAVADGLVSQEQVDWMQSRRGGQTGQGGQGRMGGQGAAGAGGVCLYTTAP